MEACKHKSLEYVGEQKTEEGVNSYYKCRDCGELLVITPSRKAIGVPGVETDQHSPSGAGTKS